MNFKQRIEGAKRFRRYILNRDQWTCYLCSAKLTGEPGTEASATIDHVQSKRHGKRYDPRNVRAACKKCNREKGGYLTEQEYRLVLLFRQGLIALPALKAAA